MNLYKGKGVIYMFRSVKPDLKPSVPVTTDMSEWWASSSYLPSPLLRLRPDYLRGSNPQDVLMTPEVQSSELRRHEEVELYVLMDKEIVICAIQTSKG